MNALAPKSPESLKAESERRILRMGGEVNASLPVIEAIDEVYPMSAEAVARRACVLSHLAAAAFGQPDAIQEAARRIRLYGLWDAASRQERKILGKKELSAQESINCSWSVEAIQALAWSLGLAGLDHRQPCDDDLASHFPAEDPTDFINRACLRALPEIQAQADLLYRLHWYARNCQLNDRDCIVSESLIRERRKAIDWVLGVEADWDEVPGDT